MQNSPAEVVGIWLARILLSVGPLLSIIFNLRALRHRRTNGRCILAIVLTSVCWLLVFLLGSAARTTSLDPLVGVGLGFACAISMIASTILAIMGLSEYVDDRGYYRHGRKRAITALSINALTVGLLGFSIYYSYQGKSLFPWLTMEANPSGTINDSTWNFRLDSPYPWAPLNAADFSAKARAVVGRHGPEMYSMILAEELPASTTLEDSMDLIKQRIRQDGTPVFLAEREWTERGMPGRVLETQFHGPKGDLFYLHWLTQDNGKLYQVITWAQPDLADQVRSEGQRIVGSFHLLDSHQAQATQPASGSAPFISQRFDYEVDLGGTSWTRRMVNLAANCPAAEFGATNASGSGCFCVVPVWTGEKDLDLGILTHALTARLGIPYPDEAVFGEKPWIQGQLTGRTFSYEREIDHTTFTYRFRVLQRQGFAYLLAAWIDKRSSLVTDSLDEAMDRVTFLQLAKPNPALENDRERERHMLVYNDIGLAFDRAEQNDAARTWLKKGFEMTRRNSTLLINYAQACVKCAQPAEALAAIDEALPNFPANQKLSALRAGIQYQSGDIEGALKSYEELFNSGWKSDADFTGFVGELIERGQQDKALAAIDRYTGGHESAAMQRLRAQALLSKGESDRAIALLTTLRDKSPNEPAVSLALTDAYLSSKHPAEALAECERMIDAKHETVEVLHRKGLAQLSLKRYRDAKTTLEKALAKAPMNLDLRRLVDGMSGLLGEGSNSYVKTPIEPVEIPAALQQPATADPSDEYLRGYSAWYRCVVKAIAYRKGKEMKTTDHEVIQIRDQQGVEKFSSLEFSFDPLGEEIFVNDVTVKDGSGAVVSHGKVEDSYVVDDGADQTASQAKVLHVPVPGLHPGSTLEYTVTRREAGQVKSFTFKTCALLKGLPVLRASLQVLAGSDDLHWETTPGVPAPQRAEGRTTWTVERPAVYRWEPLQAPMETFMPIVWLGDAGATWPSEAKEYMGLIKDRLEIESSIRTAAAEVIKDQPTAAAKTSALARFVQRGLTYKAIEFGRRARLPNSAAQILRNKYGDCKDHALLLCQLLESAGVPARLALVRSAGDLQARLPSLDQFDHMITYIPGANGGQFIDCTSKSGDLRSNPPLGLSSRQALVLDPKGPYLQAIPPCAADSSAISTRCEVALLHESDAEVKEVVTFNGISAAGLRATLMGVESPQRIVYLQRLMSAEAPSINLQEATIDDLDNPQAPLCLHLHYTLPARFHSVGGHLAGQLPAIWERMYVNDDPVEKRFSPFKIWAPTHIASTATLTPPPGWYATPTQTSPFKSPYLEGSARIASEQGTLRIESQLLQKAGLFPPEQYAAYLEAARKTRSLTEQDIVLERK